MSHTPSNVGSTDSNENHLVASRREKLQALRGQGFNWPNGFRRDSWAGDLQDTYKDASREQLAQDCQLVRVAGRLVLNRGAFLVLQDMTDRIQLYVNRKTLSPVSLALIKDLDLGDIIGVEGVLHRSGKGDLFVEIGSLELLTKSLRPLPDKHKGLSDTELRYRQRYLDLMTNADSRRLFQARSRILEGMRRYLSEQDFMEVETPMMQVTPGGASARPFVTHHQSLDQTMYLRIAPELYLKRLVVGGLERVFELNRCFRNEGLSSRHNPEFTTLEIYQAYADYRDLMQMTEDMLRFLARDVLGTTSLTYHLPAGSDDEQSRNLAIELGEPFSRMSLSEAVLHFNPELSPAQITCQTDLQSIAREKGINVQSGWGQGKLLMELFEATVEHQLMQPTFITGYPTEVSPLARRNDQDPTITDRFELFVCGRELANGFSELNDPEDQHERFMNQVREKQAGDVEAMHYDADYVRALEYGLPPTAGEGIGIDRLVMLFMNAPSIRDVLLFPHMRPEAPRGEPAP
ncbi:MAG: lysine--tRNA ligase [Kistimonas sp.]|nr:lysine--tRNA ligase [Kistimonas sp.]